MSSSYIYNKHADIGHGDIKFKNCLSLFILHFSFDKRLMYLEHPNKTLKSAEEYNKVHK